MRNDQAGATNAAVKALLAGVAAVAIAVGLLTPLPGHSKTEPARSQIPTLEVGKG